MRSHKRGIAVGNGVYPFSQIPQLRLIPVSVNVCVAGPLLLSALTLCRWLDGVQLCMAGVKSAFRVPLIVSCSRVFLVKGKIAEHIFNFSFKRGKAKVQL